MTNSAARGRPPKPPDQQRRMFNYRMTNAVRDQLTEAAARSGRTVSAELEHRVAASFILDRMLEDPSIVVALMQAGFGLRWSRDGQREVHAPGTHDFPQSGFQPPPEQPADERVMKEIAELRARVDALSKKTDAA